MKNILIILIFVIIGLNLVVPVSAAKKRIRRIAPGSTAVIYSTAKLNRITHSVDVYFQNLNSVSKINYELSYNANGIDQGAMGSLIPNGATDSRNLYFGTCSKGVCTPHNNITGATLTIQSRLKSGGTNTKLYRIKI
jgi:hypothetical protein